MKKKSNLSVICHFVCEVYGLTPEELFTVTRKRDIVLPRQIFLYLSRRYTYFSQSKIGEYALIYGRPEPLDHATVLHAEKTVKNLLYDKQIRTEVEYLKQVIEDYAEKVVVEKVDLLHQCIINTENLNSIEVYI